MQPPLDSAGADQTGADPLATALLPVLLHRINNVTQLLTSLNSVLVLASSDYGALPGTDGLRGQVLFDAATDAQELGWLLGVLGCGLGADLLLERREPRGLDATLRLVIQAVRRSRAELVLEPADSWPSLSGEVPSHGDLCWVVAYGLWFATRAGGELRHEREPSHGAHLLTCIGAGPVAWSPLSALLAERLPGAELQSSDQGWTLRLPASWLVCDA